jgi:hypothetical protein
METLRSLKWPVTVSPLSSGIWGRWQFPKNLWDVERQGWQAAVEHIRLWQNELIEEIENLAVESASPLVRRH